MYSSLILCAVIFTALYYYFTKTFNYWTSRNVKGPQPILLLGNYKNVALRKQHVGMFYWDMYKKYPEEKVVGLYRMTSPTLLIRDLDIVKQVLIKDFEVFADRATYFSKDGLGDNIFHANFEMWKFLRPQFSSAFTGTKIKAIYNGVVKYGDKFLDYIETTTMKKPEQNIYKLVLKYTVGTTMYSVFGMDIDTFENDTRMFEVIDEKFNTSYCTEMDMLFPGFFTKFNLSVLSDQTIKFSHQILEAGKQNTSSSKTGMKNMMDLILIMNKGTEEYDINQNEINAKQHIDDLDTLQAAQAWMFYTAGYANNTLSLTYAMYHLARNPDVQDKLREEITSVLQKNKGVMSYEALKEMKYLDMVFEETLRMHPLTNGLVRSVDREVKLEGTDITIDKGTSVVVSPYAIMHDEKYYPEPERFKPERFLPENITETHSCTYLPFGLGRRSCLGSQLARIQFTVGLAKVLSKFRVEVSKNTISSIKYNPYRLLLTPNEDVYLNLVAA